MLFRSEYDSALENDSAPKYDSAPEYDSASKYVFALKYEFFWKMDGDIDEWMDECMEGCSYGWVKGVVELSNRWNSWINGLSILDWTLITKFIETLLQTRDLSFCT